MVRDCEITLIRRGTAEQSDEYGRVVYENTERTIFAVECGVKRSEYYQAHAIGMAPSITFQCFAFDYDGEKVVRYGGKEYQVIRSYPLDGERLELVCSDIAEGQ